MKKSCKIRQMNIIVNGSKHACPANESISGLLQRLEMQDKKIAIEINKEVIPKGEYDAYALSDGDIIEIIQAIGGG